MWPSHSRFFSTGTLVALFGIQSVLAFPGTNPFSLTERNAFPRRSSDVSSGNIGVLTTNNNFYVVNITIGGEEFVVHLDTGSTDLWVNATGRNIQYTNKTGIPVEETYGSGAVKGTLDFAEVKIGDVVLNSQAFLTVTNSSNMTGVDGILGMAFDTSSIFATLNETWGQEAAETLGASPITSFFAKVPSIPNNFDVQLGRVTTDTPDGGADGAFYVSRHAPGFELVETMPKLLSLNVAHWSVLMAGLKVNGKPIALQPSRVQGMPNGFLVAILDTGFSLPGVPRDILDAIYGNIHGAAYDEDLDTYIVPCMTSPNVTFTLGSQDILVHPLDLTTTDTDGDNKTFCKGTYQPLDLDPNEFAGFDLALGDAFLRSVYASFDYGDYHPGDIIVTGEQPFVRLVQTTNASSAWAEFLQERAAKLQQLPPLLNPEDLYGTATTASVSASVSATGVAGALVASGSSASPDSWGAKYGTLALALLGANLLVGVLVFAVALTMCARGVKGREARVRYAPVPIQMGAESERAELKYGD